MFRKGFFHFFYKVKETFILMFNLLLYYLVLCENSSNGIIIVKGFGDGRDLGL